MKTNNTPNHGAHCQLNFLYNENPYSPISSMFKNFVFHALFLIFIRFGRKILPDLEYNQREMLRHLPRLINLEGGRPFKCNSCRSSISARFAGLLYFFVPSDISKGTTDPGYGVRTLVISLIISNLATK